jgi:hypothetical protein
MKRRTKNLIVGYGLGWSGVLLALISISLMFVYSDIGAWQLWGAMLLSPVACVLGVWGSTYLYAEGIDIYQKDGPWDKTGKF